MRDQAIELMKAGRYEEAFERFDKLLSRSRTDWSLFYMAGQCARFSNDLPKAAYLLQRSAALNPNEPQVYLALGIALQLTNQLSESVEAFRRAIELDGDLVSAYNSLAITQKRIGQLDLARHNLEEALKALGRCIAKDLRNERVTPIAPHPTTAGDHWTQVAIDAAMFLYARSSNISKMAWPTGQQAVEEARTRRHGGLFWEDKIDSQAGCHQADKDE